MELKYSAITEKIIGCAMRLHSKMGMGYPEIIYARCLPIEFDRVKLNYETEKTLPIYYNDFIVSAGRVDFMVEDKIAVELKALSTFNYKDIVQALSYLQSHCQGIALLLNFGATSLRFKRIINNKNPQKPIHLENHLQESKPEYNTSNLTSNFNLINVNPDNPSKNPDNPWS